MPILKIENVGELGVVTDVHPTQLPPNAWTNARNLRFDHRKAIKFKGHEQYFDPSDASAGLGTNWDGAAAEQVYHLLPVADGSNYYWIFCGLKDVGVFNAVTKTCKEITPAAGDFSATDANVDWTSCIIGGTPVINNGVDLPHMWAQVSGALDFGTPQLLTQLTGFSAATGAGKCGALRAFKNYLVALDVTKSGTRYPSLVKWSDSSALGSVPASWDSTDQTTDAGEVELAGTRTDTNVGICLDCMPLRDINIIYRDDSVWSMSFIGGTFVFAFRLIYSNQGMLTRRCMAEFEGKHFVVGNSDVYVHDGTNFQSIIDERRKDFFFNDIDSTYYDRTYVFANYPKTEMWICYVSVSSNDTWPNKAMVWNWRHGTWGCRDLPSTTAHIEGGQSSTQDATDIWSTPDGTWLDWNTSWGDLGYTPQIISPVMANDIVWKADSTNQFAGTSFTSFAERTGIPLGEQDEFCRVKAVYPRMTGGPVEISVGTQMAPDDTPVYQESVTFTPGVDQKVDARVTGTFLALKIQSTSDNTWECSGIDAEFEMVSRR